MQFLWSPFLWSLLLVPALVGLYAWLLRRRGKYALRYPSLSLVRPALDRRARWRRYIPPALFFIALALMLFALARPVAVIRTPRQEGIIILALDSSISMRANDMDPTRFEAARRAAHAFIDKRAPGTAIGIVTFAGNAVILQLPTTKDADLHAALNRLTLQRGTAIGSGILTSLDAIAISFQGEPAATGSLGAAPTASPGAPSTPEPVPTLPPVPPGTNIPAIIVLLTDGQNRNGPDPVESAQTAFERGVRVYTVGIGSRDGGTIPGGLGGAPNSGALGQGNGRVFGGANNNPGGFFVRELDEDTLRAIADATGGEYFYAPTTDELTRVYSNLGLNLVLRVEKSELTAYISAVAAFLLVIALALSWLWTSLNA